jgi:hypothetical protein
MAQWVLWVLMQSLQWFLNRRDFYALCTMPMGHLTSLPYWICLTHTDRLAGPGTPVSVWVVRGLCGHHALRTTTSKHWVSG